MIEIALTLMSLAIAVVGCIFMHWVIRHCLPLASGPYLWLKFWLWLGFGVGAAWTGYTIIVVSVALHFFPDLIQYFQDSPEVFGIAATILTFPGWFGFIYSFKVQLGAGTVSYGKGPQ